MSKRPTAANTDSSKTKLTKPYGFPEIILADSFGSPVAKARVERLLLIAMKAARGA